MKYKIVVDKQSRTNPSNEKREYEIDIEELRAQGNVYDSLVITRDEDYVMRRLTLSEYHVLSVLEEPVKEPLTDINIELFEGDNYIYLVDMTGNKFYAEYLIKNDFTDTYVTVNQMNSAINQTAGQIELTVNQKLEGYSTTEEMNSAIKVTADGISSEVSKKVGEDEIISKINQSAEKILISGDKIDINGKAVNFSTEINQTFGPYTESDIERIKKIIVNQITPTNEDYNKYDIDGDGIISTIDWLRVSNAINKGNGYYKVTGTFNIDPYSTQKSVKIYNGDTPMSILSVLSNYFREIDISNQINFLENNDTISGWISSNGFSLCSNTEKTNEASSFIGVSSVNDETVGNFNIGSSYGGIFANTCSDVGAEIILSKYSDFIQTIVKATGITTPILTQTSLEESKKNFEKLESGLSIIKDIDIYKYNLKSEEDNTKKHIGFVIGDEYKYSKEVTSSNNEGVDIYSFVAICCKAIQELIEKNKELEQRIEKLEVQNEKD